MMPVISPRGRVIYDDTCGICRAFRKTAEKRDKSNKLEFIPRREADPDDYLPYSRFAIESDSVIFIDSQGHSHKGASAIGLILKQIKRPWNIVGKMISFPIVRSIADFVYRIIARHRNRL
jgi:predicted DCC family thiol-disulfide oxidoreductase YuxK